MADEKIDIIDEEGNVQYQEMKMVAHEKGLLHKTVIGYLRDGDNWTLVKQADDRQDAGQHVAPVGGHVSAGETELEGLTREVEEEIGAKNLTHKLIGRAIFHRQVIGRDENHMFIVYEISTDDPIVLNHESVATKTYTSQELKNTLRDNPEEFGDAFYFVIENFYHDFLPLDYSDKYI